MQTTIDRFGRIVLPKKLRNDFNLEPDSQFHIEESGQETILKSFNKSFLGLCGFIAIYPVS